MGEEEEKKEEKEKKKDVKENGEIVMKVDMHCEGCARKVVKSLKRFDGVEQVRVDLKMHRVVVKGKVENALKMCERIEKKNAKKVEFVSPSKEVIEAAVKKAEEEEKKNAKTVVKKEEEKPAIIVVLNVHMHCENCSQELRRTIEKMKGIQSVEVDLKRQQVTVKGVFESESLAAHVRRRTGKHAAVVKQETVQKKEEQDKSKEGKKGKGGGGGEAEKKVGLGDEVAAATKAAEGVKRSETPVVPRYVDYAYPIQIFSDENPNACSVM